jgi:hypothetical protein
MEFVASFEPDVLTCLFNNELLFASVESIQGTPFNQTLCQDIYNEVVKFRATEHKMPVFSELQQAVHTHVKKSKEGILRLPDYDALLAMMFLNKPNSNYTVEYVTKQIQDILVSRVFTNYSMQSEDEKVKMTLDELQVKLDVIRSMDAATVSEREEVSYTLDTELRKEMYTKDDNVKKVPTPWEQLNCHIRGGPGLGDECIVIGPTGRGKSTILAALTSGAMKEGIGVLYFNLETSVVDTCEMLDAHFIQKSRVDIRTHYCDSFDEMIHDKMCDIADGAECGDKELCKILAYPPNTVTLNHIEHDIKKHMSSIHNFRMVVIDWGDCIKPMRQYSERRHEYADIFHGIKALARKYHLVIWAATMGNKDSLSKKVVTLQDIAESYAKAFMARLIITICQTPEEKNSVDGGFPGPIFRFWIAKNSKGPGEIEIPMKIDYGTVDITYNDKWTEDMKELYGFRKYKKENKQPKTAEDMAATYSDDGVQTKAFLTNDVFAGKEISNAYKYKSPLFNSFREGTQT